MLRVHCMYCALYSFNGHADDIVGMCVLGYAFQRFNFSKMIVCIV